MKKLILLLVLLTNFAFAQNTITWYRITRDTSSLNYNPFATTNTVTTGYININPKTGEQKRYTSNSTWVTDTLIKLSSTNVTNISNSSTISPEQYGAVNASLTFAQKGISQAKIDSTYPGMGFTTSDMIDWAAWQMAVKQACLIGGGVTARGGTYYINKPITLEKVFRGLEINGSYCKIISTGTGAIITRISPGSNSEALTMVESKVFIHNLFLSGSSSQIGIDIGPTYGALYQNIFCSGLAENIHLRFGLRTHIDNCFSTNCNKGWIADKGNWSGASNSNSQSNHTSFTNCRWFGAGDQAFGIIASSGCLVEDCIIEGTSVRAGIDFDGNGSTVVKDFTVRNTHFECASGATEACIKIRMHSGIATIDKVYGQYAAILVDAGATTGYMNVKVTNVSYWVMKVGKAFNNAGNVSWVFDGNDNPLQTSTPSTTVPTWFNGTAVSQCSGAGCGSNRFFYTPIPR